MAGIGETLDKMGPTIDQIVAKAVGLPPPPAAEKPKAEAPAAPVEVEEQPAEAVEAEEPESAAELDTEPEKAKAPEEKKSPAPAKAKGSDELRKAREAAKLAGLPESTVKSMSEADLRAFSKAKAKNDADRQRTFQENAELKRQLAEAKTPAKAAGQPAAAEALDPELVAEVGERGARALDERYAKKIAALEARVQAAEAKAQDQQVRSIFDAMQEAGEFGPGVPDYTQALEKATALSRADGLYAGLEGEERARAIFLDAVKLLPASTPSSPEPDEDKEEDSPAETATVTRVPQRTVRAKPQNGSPEASVDRMIDAVVRRGARNPTEIARKYG